MKRFLSILLKLVAILLILFVTAIFLIPILYKKEIVELVRKSVNDQINGELQFKDANLSIIRNFPGISLIINEPHLISFSGKDTTDLFKSDELSVIMDFWNIIKRDEILFIKGVDLLQPTIHLVTFNDSTSNFNILKDTSTVSADSNSGVELNLDRFTLINGLFTYKDYISEIQVSAKGINQTVKANLAKENTMIVSNSSIDSLSLQMGGITYLHKARFKALIDLNHNLNLSTLDIKKGDLILNNLNLVSTGDVAFLEDGSQKINLKLESAKSEVKDLFSLIPSAFKGDYKDVQSEGQFSLKALINGIYNSEQSTYPSFDFDMNVKNGKVKYPGMQFSLDQINLDLNAKDEGNKLENTDVRIPVFGFSLNQKKISGNANLIQLQQDTKVSGQIKGGVSLSDFVAFIPLEAGTSMKGDINADIDFDFNKSAIEKQDYERIKLKGILDILNMTYVTIDMPVLQVDQMKLLFDNNACQIPSSNIRFGKSDLSLKGNAINPLALIMEKGKSTMNFTVDGNLFDVDEWMSSGEEAIAEKPIVSSNSGGFQDYIDLRLDAKYKRIKYEDFLIEDAVGKIKYNNDKLEIESFNAIVNKNAIQLRGQLNPVMAFASDLSRLNGNINVTGGKIDLAQFMSVSTESAPSQTVEATAFEAPVGMDIQVDFKFDELKYDKWSFAKPNGVLVMDDHEIQLREFKSNSLGGLVNMQGLYNSENLKKPIFDFKYDMKNVQFNKAFASVKTIAVLAPIFKFIEGNFNTSIVCSGSLTPDMSPVFSSLNLNGLIETLDGFINAYPPLQKIASKLGVDELKSFSLQNTKNWVNVENGTLKINPGEKMMKDIKVKYVGSHQIQGDMDYQLVFNIPKSKIRNSPLGNATETGMSFLQGLASKVNMELKSSTHINVGVQLTGKLLDPKVSIKLLSNSGESLDDAAKNTVKDMAESAADSLRNRANQEIDILKKKALDESKRVEDSLRKLANKKIEEEKNKIMDKASDELKKRLDSGLVEKGKEVIGDKLNKETEMILKEVGKKEVDSIKSKVEEWNPFKKKKK
ncbi:MAG: hypothetical protein IPO62_16105 [Saprospiraceae bacterium]|nr:hypothetical protein [Saprospiraceae bacterium]